MASINLKWIADEVVVLYKGHIVQINQDGSEKYLQQSNIEIPLNDIVKYMCNKKER